MQIQRSVAEVEEVSITKEPRNLTPSDTFKTSFNLYYHYEILQLIYDTRELFDQQKTYKLFLVANFFFL